MDLSRVGQVIQKLVGMLRARSFSMTLGIPNGQRAATRKGLGGRPSWRETASPSPIKESLTEDRKSVAEGKSVALGGCRIIITNHENEPTVAVPTRPISPTQRI